MLDEKDRQRVARTGARGPPAKLLAGRAPSNAFGRVGHVDPAPSHRGHVGLEVVALHSYVAEAAAAGEELGEPGVGAPGGHRGVALAQAQKLEIVLLVKGDRVVGPPARVGAARVYVESDSGVGVDTSREVRDADHDVVDAGQHLALRAEHATPRCRSLASSTPRSVILRPLVAASPDSLARRHRLAWCTGGRR